MVLRKRQMYQVELLSPVHVGSGERLGPAEIAVIGGQLWRFDPERLTAALARHPRMLDDYIQKGAAALQVWGEADRRACARYVRPWTGSAPREVRACIVDPLGRPYVPGSSVKGAIRTALVFAALSQLPDPRRKALMEAVERHAQETKNRKREFADDPVMSEIMGKDPHHDLLRALRISDSTPAPPEALGVGRVRVAVQERNGALSWLRAPGQHGADPAQAFPIDLELIRPSASGPLSITVEIDLDLLKKDPTASEPRLRLVQEWERHCNAFARHLAEREAAWGEQVGLDAYRAFYRRLLEEMQEDPQAIYLNIGWGGGWRSKTAAEALGPMNVQRLRRLFGLGRGDPFPKTRRVLFEGGKPTIPPGWIRLRRSPPG